MNHKFINRSYHIGNQNRCSYILIIIDYVEEEHVIYHDIESNLYFLYLDSFDDATIDYLVSNNIGFISGNGPTLTKIALNPHVILEMI